MSRINLSKIKKCNQIWDNMSVCDGGRFCDSCQNVIYDLRGKSEMEIGLIHANSETKVCGIYDEHILDRKDRRKRKSKKLVLAGLVGILTSGTSWSQEASPPVEIVEKDLDASQNDQVVKTTSNSSQDSLFVVRGILTDEDKEILVGANVLVKGTEYGNITDINGKFNLDVSPFIDQNDSITLIFSYIGFGKEELQIAKNEFNQSRELNIPVIMKERMELTAFGVRRPPWYKRLWNNIKSIF